MASVHMRPAASGRRVQGSHVADGSSSAGHGPRPWTAVVRRADGQSGYVGDGSRLPPRSRPTASQVGQAFNVMDRATQQNAALVEQSAAAAESPNQQAKAMMVTVSRFRLRAG